MRVFVALINWNAWDLTLECLKSLDQSSYPIEKIIVFDNGSTDGSVAHIETAYPTVQVMRSDTNLGFTGGSNRAIRQALADGAEAVWVLNNDTEVSADCLGHMVAALESDDQVAAVGNTIFYHDRRDRIWYAGAWINHATLQARHRNQGKLGDVAPRTLTEVDFITGCSMLIRRDALERVGLFDDEFFAYAEDFDWCLRARRLGYKLLLAPQAHIWHRVSASVRRNTLGNHPGFASPRAYYLASRNMLWIIRKHASNPWRLWWATGVYLLERVPHLTGIILMGRRAKAAALVSGLRDGLLAPISRG